MCTLECRSIVSRISVRVVNWKISGERRLVMIRVFEGGDGWTSCGRSEKSRVSGDLEPDDARERWGDGSVACMFMVASIGRWLLV